MRLLKALEAQNRWNIVIAEQLPFAEYCKTVARSKITLSVEGKGWDCFRHYEAVALGSLPFINRPTVDVAWWHGMPGEIYFENNFSNFTEQLEYLLNQEALRRQCLENMGHVIRGRMVWSKIIDDVVEQTMHTISPHEHFMSMGEQHENET